MNNPKQKTVIIICGPTAVGKTALAIHLATHFHTAIISADSRQCFKELKIGVARPSAEELQQIKHYFIASHSVNDEVTAVSFEQYALEKAAELFREQDVIVMAGGTGLYIRAFCEGLDAVPELRAEVRGQITEKYNKYGLKWLQEEVRIKDPEFFAVGEIQNPQRMMRALEVLEATGRSIQSFRKGEKMKRDFNIIKIGLELPREEIVKNIDSRVEQMIKAGLVAEVKALLPVKGLNALQTVGYAELFDHFEGKLGLDETIEQIKIHTRQYAKRQMTWFKKDSDIKWFGPSELQAILDHLHERSVLPHSS